MMTFQRSMQLVLKVSVSSLVFKKPGHEANPERGSRQGIADWPAQRTGETTLLNEAFPDGRVGLPKKDPAEDSAESTAAQEGRGKISPASHSTNPTTNEG